MVLLPLNLVHADHRNLVKVSMLQALFDDVFDGMKHFLPRCLKAFADLGPRQTPRPACEKLHVGFCQLVLALGPRYVFDPDAATRTIDTPHDVHEKHRVPPQRHKLEPARFFRVVVTRCGFVAA